MPVGGAQGAGHPAALAHRVQRQAVRSTRDQIDETVDAVGMDRTDLVGVGSTDPHDLLGRVKLALFEHQDGETGIDDQTLIVVLQQQ